MALSMEIEKPSTEPSITNINKGLNQQHPVVLAAQQHTEAQ